MLNSHSSVAASPRQPQCYPAPFLVQPCNLLIEGTCEKAKTWSGKMIQEESVLVAAVTCKRWGCRYCSRIKISRLATLCKLAGPNRLLTLTVDPKNYQSPRHAFDATAGLVPELIRSLRKRFGEVEYLRVTELHKSGFPHYHMLIRSGFLPHAVVKAEWNRLTQNQIVDLRQVDGSFQSYTYLTKYLSKLHRIEWTDRHVSYSKKFFPDGSLDKPKGDTVVDGKIHNCHPFEFLANHCMNRTVLQTGRMTFILTSKELVASTSRPDGF